MAYPEAAPSILRTRTPLLPQTDAASAPDTYLLKMRPASKNNIQFQEPKKQIPHERLCQQPLYL